MPTSLGIMQIFFGPPPPPPPCDGCWPTPQDATTRTNAISRATRTTLNLHAGLDTFSPPFRYALLCFTYRLLECGSLLPSPEKLVQEHGHEEQDAKHEDYPGARHPGQRQAVAQCRDDEDAEHGAAYGPRSAVDASPAEDHGGDHVEFQPKAGVAARRVDPRGIDDRGHAHQ